MTLEQQVHQLEIRVRKLEEKEKKRLQIIQDLKSENLNLNREDIFKLFS